MKHTDKIETILVFENSKLEKGGAHHYAYSVYLPEVPLREDELMLIEALNNVIHEEHEECFAGDTGAGIAVNGKVVYEKGFGEDIPFGFYDLLNRVKKFGQVHSTEGMGFKTLSAAEEGPVRQSPVTAKGLTL